SVEEGGGRDHEARDVDVGVGAVPPQPRLLAARRDRALRGLALETDDVRPALHRRAGPLLRGLERVHGLAVRARDGDRLRPVPSEWLEGHQLVADANALHRRSTNPLTNYYARPRSSFPG